MRPSGSSPRGRGKLQVGDAGGAGGGLIPARAGKTSGRAASSPRGGAHPRAGGENRAFDVLGVGRMGSSPRGRGKRPDGSRPRNHRRLIPARAGKTSRPRLRSRRRRAHPRAGGENVSDMLGSVRKYGSSPRGRGKRLGHLPCLPQPGLIPARAGKTAGVVTGLRSAWAHPRAGGENHFESLSSLFVSGSSPRGRGKHFLTCAFIERIGQILETLELAVSSGSYSLCDVYATDAPRDPARSIGLVPLSNRDASSESVLRSRRASRDLPTSGKRGPARCAHDRPGPPALSSCSP